jgi:hypothetical protein
MLRQLAVTVLTIGIVLGILGGCSYRRLSDNDGGAGSSGEGGVSGKGGSAAGGGAATSGRGGVGGSSVAGSSVSGVGGSGGTGGIGGVAGSGGTAGVAGGSVGGRGGSGGSGATGGVAGGSVAGRGGSGAGGGTGGAAGSSVTGRGGSVGTGGVAGSGVGGRGGSSGTGSVAGRGGIGGIGGSGGIGGMSGSGATGGAAGAQPCSPGCQSYQYCNGTKCLPEYRSTKLLPLEPAAGADQVFYVLPAAIVASNGDLYLQARIQGRITYAPSGLGTSLGSTAEFTDLMTVARLSASGVLQWARDMAFILGDRANSLFTSSIGLAPNDDVMVAYTRTDPPPPPPGTATAQTRLGRIDGGNPTLLWEASYGSLAIASKVVTRSSRGDFLTVGGPPNQFQGCCDKVVQVSAGGATATILGDYYAYGVLPGRDGSTIWMFGAYAGTLRLNPWSSMTWNVPSNPNQLGLYDAFIVGAKDDGTSFGPWVTQGDIGPNLAGLVLAADGNPVISMGGSASTRINGQDLLQGEGHVLAKLNAATGVLMWKTDTTDASQKVVATGDGNIALLVAGSTSPTVRLYASGDGAARASFQVPGIVEHIAAGSSDMFVVGVIQGSADFNPGTAVDMQSTTTPAIYISRFSF